MIGISVLSGDDRLRLGRGRGRGIRRSRCSSVSAPIPSRRRCGRRRASTSPSATRPRGSSSPRQLARGQARRGPQRVAGRVARGARAARRGSSAQRRSSSCTSASAGSGQAKGGARAAWRRAEADPDTPYALSAQTTCCIRTSLAASRSSSRRATFRVPRDARSAGAARNVARRRGGRSRTRCATASRCSGSAQPVSAAARLRRRPCALAPRDPRRWSAAAVGRFTKDDPVRRSQGSAR